MMKELYVEIIHMAKKNNELKEQLQGITEENDIFMGELRSKDEELGQSKAKAWELEQQLANKEGINKMLDMLLSQNSSSCKMGLEGWHHDGEYKKPIVFVNASIPLKEDYIK